MKEMKKSQIVGLIGMPISIIAAFLPYIKIGEETFNMFSMGKDAKSVAILLIIMAIISGLLSFFGKNKVWWLSFINLIVSSLAAFLIFAHLNHLKENETSISIAIYIFAVGFVICVVASVLGILKK